MDGIRIRIDRIARPCMSTYTHSYMRTCSCHAEPPPLQHCACSRQSAGSCRAARERCLSANHIRGDRPGYSFLSPLPVRAMQVHDNLRPFRYVSYSAKMLEDVLHGGDVPEFPVRFPCSSTPPPQRRAPSSLIYLARALSPPSAPTTAPILVPTEHPTTPTKQAAFHKVRQ